MNQLLMFRPHLENIPSAGQVPAGYEVRRFGPDDGIEALGETLYLAFEREFDWSVEKVRERLTEDPNVRAIYAAFWEGRAVATTTSLYKPEKYPDTGIVHWVATHPDHLRKGLGTVLLERVLHDFVENGDREALLETDDQRLPAIRRYLAFGFLPRYDHDGEDLRTRWSAVFQAIGARGNATRG